VRAARHDENTYLELAASLSRDDTPAITSEIAARVTYTGNNLARDSDRAAYGRWIIEQFEPVLNQLGWPGGVDDSDALQSRRAALLELVGLTAGDESVQRRARELAAGYLADPESLPPTLASPVLRVAAVGGDRALYDQYVAQLDKLADTPEEYYRFLGALPWFRDPALVRRTLEFALSPAVRSQDTGTLVGNAIARPWSRTAAWAFTREHWGELTMKLGTFQGIPTIVTSLGAFCSPEGAAEVRQFFAAHPVPSSERTLQQSIERIESCAALQERQAPALARWLAARQQ
jgi:aminopeptidase N